MPLVVNYTQRRVAVLHRVSDDTNGQHIVDLVERDTLPLELLIHRVSTLDPALNPRRHIFARQLLLNMTSNLVEPALMLGPL